MISNLPFAVTLTGKNLTRSEGTFLLLVTDFQVLSSPTIPVTHPATLVEKQHWGDLLKAPQK